VHGEGSAANAAQLVPPVRLRGSLQFRLAAVGALGARLGRRSRTTTPPIDR
jgi:hypothetical protein